MIKSPIISCSRRTDIPAFNMKWLLQKLKQGFVDVRNPFNKNQVSCVSLSPTDVKCWVWWSKNYSNWIEKYKEHKPKFNSYIGHIFHFTINSPSFLELNLNISLTNRLQQLEWLISEFGIDSVNYRYDPIILFRKKDNSKIESNLGKFEYIIEQVSKLGIYEVIFSFATLYPKVLRRMNHRGIVPISLTLEKKKGITNKLVKICGKYNIQMRACCQPGLLSLKGISQAHCIDVPKINKVFGLDVPEFKDKGQRDACGCSKSKDIGGYSGIFRCKHNCAYCYANPAKK